MPNAELATIGRVVDGLTDEQILQRVRALYEELRTDTQARWNRDLPFEELLFDRWERARRLGFGEGSSIYHNSYVYGDVRVGRDTWIGPFTLLDGSGGLTIGDGCDISAGVQIYTHDTVRRVLSEHELGIDRAAVAIGERCHIGAGSIVLAGVTIGDHAVIGAGSLVNQAIPSRSVAVGSPCRVIGRVVIEEGDVRLVYDH